MTVNGSRIILLAALLLLAAGGGPRSEASSPGDARISAITFTDRTENGRPVGAAKTFAAGTRRIYAVFHFEALDGQEVLEGRWISGSQEVMKQATRLAEVFNGPVPKSGRLWFWIQWDGGARPGKYRFELRINGRFAREGTFEVKEQ